MTKIYSYLNFAGQAEDAFTFYKSVFGTEFDGGIARFGEVPASEGMPELSDADKQLIMNVQLPIGGGHMLMGSDVPDAMGGQALNKGNNFYIGVQTDTREEADALFASLSADGKVEMALAEMFWGDYFGSLADKFGTQWMINCTSKS